MTDYERYLYNVRKYPEMTILVKEGEGYCTYGRDAVLVAAKLDKPLLRVNRHRIVDVTQDEINLLVADQKCNLKLI